jgi:hypothetical protein
MRGSGSPPLASLFALTFPALERPVDLFERGDARRMFAPFEAADSLFPHSGAIRQFELA